jgi:hypothetical protein
MTWADLLEQLIPDARERWEFIDACVRHVLRIERGLAQAIEPHCEDTVWAAFDRVSTARPRYSPISRQDGERLFRGFFHKVFQRAALRALRRIEIEQEAWRQGNVLDQGAPPDADDREAEINAENQLMHQLATQALLDMVAEERIGRNLPSFADLILAIGVQAFLTFPHGSNGGVDQAGLVDRYMKEYQMEEADRRVVAETVKRGLPRLKQRLQQRLQRERAA